MDLQREIGRRIQAARIQAGFTQEEAASTAGIDWRRWQRIENGTVNPTVRTLSRVAAALGSSFWELLAPPALATHDPPQRARQVKRRAKLPK